MSLCCQDDYFHQFFIDILCEFIHKLTGKYQTIKTSQLALSADVSILPTFTGQSFVNKLQKKLTPHGLQIRKTCFLKTGARSHLITLLNITSAYLK